MAQARKLKVRIDQEVHELHTLAGCPGFHPDIQKTCSPSSVACLDGAIDDMDGYSRGANGLLAHFDLLAGSHHVMGLRGSDLPDHPGSSVGLYVNDQLFTLDDEDQTRPVWAVIVKQRSEESLYVTVYTTLQSGSAAFRREVAEISGGTDCTLGLMDHGLGEPCDCAGVPKARLDLRALIPRTQHCQVSTFPEWTCRCGLQVQTPELPEEHPTLGEHLDDVVEETLRICQLRLQAQPELERLAPDWRGSLADLANTANSISGGA